MSFAALALRARAANDTTRAQINNIPSKSHVIPLLFFKRRNFSAEVDSICPSSQERFLPCEKASFVLCIFFLNDGFRIQLKNELDISLSGLSVECDNYKTS